MIQAYEFYSTVTITRSPFFAVTVRKIDLFSLYVLFSHLRPRDATRENSFFQMSWYALANVRIANDKNKGKIPARASRVLKWEKMYKLKTSISQGLKSTS